MACGCNTNSKYPISATLVFKTDEIIDDVRAWAYNEGDLIGDEHLHNKHQTQDIAESGNLDLITRLLSRAHKQSLGMLFPYVSGDVSDGEFRDNKLRARSNYVINLNLPKDFSSSTLCELEHALHAYYVAYVMYEWLSVTNTEKAAVWLSKMQDAESDIQEAKNARSKLTRIRLYPAL